MSLRPNLLVIAAALTTAGCGGAESTGPDATPPTYSELYTMYFAQGTPGHCANAGCHGDPDHNIWLCGPTKDTCYAGMVAQGLVTPAAPLSSPIASRTLSPLIWVNPNGFMPFDSRAPNRAAGDAIIEWVAAGAHND